jgi:SRSO17 transposase
LLATAQFFLHTSVQLDWSSKEFRRVLGRFPQFMNSVSWVLGRSERRQAAVRYVEGLLMDGQRKSIEPMANRLGVQAQGLQQFVTDSPWSDAELWRVIRQQIISHLEPLESWIIDETSWIKQGRHSVGVGQQYCGAVGKNANCQVNVQLAVSNGLSAAPIAARLFLPENWTTDASRREQAGIPAEVSFATKPQIAVSLIEEALKDQVQKAPVLGDCVYGDSYRLRQALRERGLEFFLQVTPSQHKAWTQPVLTRKERKRRHVLAGQPEALSLEQITQQLVQNQQWKDCSWKAANGSTQFTRLAWTEVYLGRALIHPGHNLEAAWLVVDWPKDKADPYAIYLAHLHRQPSTALCLRLSRSRWQIEQYFQRSKDDLGLDHYEGRSWRGFHHHLVLSALAYLFILIEFQRSKKNFCSHVGMDAPSDPSVVAETHRVLSILQNQN